MAALGVITLFLTGFMLVYYGYLSRHTEKDVSLFMSVGLISMVMNLCTNSAGTFMIAILYLVVAVAFLGLGFLVSTDGSIAFYTSIGPWFKQTFTDTALIGWKILSFVLAPVGIVLFFVYYNSKPDFAKTCGACGIWGLLVWLLLLWMILGLVL